MSQLDLSFDSNASSDGFAHWQEQRREGMKAVARKLDLPLGHSCEVWLKDNVRLRGVLRLREECLFLPESGEANLQFVVDGVSFTVGEMESYIRTD